MGRKHKKSKSQRHKASKASTSNRFDYRDESQSSSIPLDPEDAMYEAAAAAAASGRSNTGVPGSSPHSPLAASNAAGAGRSQSYSPMFQRTGSSGPASGGHVGGSLATDRILPLTNHNLQSLLAKSSTTPNAGPAGGMGNGNGIHHSRTYGGAVALDMDEFTREQHRIERQQQAGVGSDSQSWTQESISEFGGSNPSSDHSSELSSLDDFQEYYDNEDDYSTEDGRPQWPDLKILEEFVKEEVAMFQEEFLAQQRQSYPGPGGAAHGSGGGDRVTFPPLDDTVSPTNEEHGYGFDDYDDSVSDTSPLLVNKKVNESESLESLRSRQKGRIPPLTEWNQARDIKPILNNRRRGPSAGESEMSPSPDAPDSPSRLQYIDAATAGMSPSSPSKRASFANRIDPDLNRYSYFRQDMDKTIHSPTISGLLEIEPDFRLDADDADRPSGSRAPSRSPTKRHALEDLFRPSYYSRGPQLPNTGGANTPRVPPGAAASGAASTHESESGATGSGAPAATQPAAAAAPSGGSGAQGASAPATAPPLPTVEQGGTTPNSTLSPNPNNPNGAAGAAGAAAGSTSKFTSPLQQMTPLNESIADTETDETETYPFWLDILDPTIEELKVISKTFGIHPLTTEDIFLRETREKVETFKSYYFICFRSFDVIHERRKQKAKENDKKMSKLKEMLDKSDESGNIFGNLWRKMTGGGRRDDRRHSLSPEFYHNNHYGSTSGHLRWMDNNNNNTARSSGSMRSRNNKKNNEEISPLNMYMIVFRDAVLTFHFTPTPHPINVRRRVRGNDSLVSSDWICYALLDNVIDGFAPMIESIEVEVNLIEDAILKIHAGDSDSEEDTDDEAGGGGSSDDEDREKYNGHRAKLNRANTSTMNVFFKKRKRTKSTVEADGRFFGSSGFASGFRGGAANNNAANNYNYSSSNNHHNNLMNSFHNANTTETRSRTSKSKTKSSSSSNSFKIIGWKRKGDMLRRIGECRKRVMSLIRLLGSKPGVIKGFSIRIKDEERRGVSKLGPGYLSDIQDHVVTMVQSLKHCEKLSARFHKNYLAQLNIDMTQVSNDTNDVLGKITILGTIVLPINVVTGLWGMNCIVPGQDVPGLTWFWSIVTCMFIFSVIAYNFAKRVTGL